MVRTNMDTKQNVMQFKYWKNTFVKDNKSSSDRRI